MYSHPQTIISVASFGSPDSSEGKFLLPSPLGIVCEKQLPPAWVQLPVSAGSERQQRLIASLEWAGPTATQKHGQEFLPQHLQQVTSAPAQIAMSGSKGLRLSLVA